LSPSVLFVLKGYPRLSETFIAQEIRALERRGLAIGIVSLRRPTEAKVHPVHGEILAPILYLPEYLFDQPLRVLRGWRRARRLPGYAAARRVLVADLRRDPSHHRLRRFGQALVLAAEMPAGVTQLHAHFLHTPASVARYAALMAALPWTASAHARDIWTTPDWELAEKLADADWVVTCTAYGRDRLAALAPKPGCVSLLYHGLDFARFPPSSVPASRRDGRDANDPVIVLSVGRAVAKKGYDDLLRALALLPKQLHWRFVHVGGGLLAEALKAEAKRLGLDRQTEWLGPQPQDMVLARYRGADLFALASRIADDGDRDGLPNVLMEAQSQSLAVVATRLSAVPELIDDGQTGLLVPPGDSAALAAALARLIADPDLRARLGRAGFEKVRGRFGMAAGIADLARRFGLPPAAEDGAGTSEHAACT
jgi:glycosyltransferase involved in cell wall biosynthesis